MMKEIKRQFPTSRLHMESSSDLFKKFDKDNDGQLTINQLTELLRVISSKLTNLPATAQVASQQGAYLGKKLSKVARRNRANAERGESEDNVDDLVADVHPSHPLVFSRFSR